VIVTVDAGLSDIPTLQEHAALGIRKFADYPGYIGGALHVSVDGTRLIQYLQWESESSYRACIDDPLWEELPSSRHFLEAVSSGQAHLDARVFHVAVSNTSS